MNIAFDVDGVFTDFEWFMNEYGKRFFRRKKRQVSICVAERFGYGKKMETLFYVFYLIWYAKKYPIRENVASVIRKLKQQGNHIYIITARAMTEYNNFIGRVMRKLLIKWLARNGVVYDEIYFCSSQNSSVEKCKWCRKLEIDIFVEDDPRNICKLKEICRVICMTADYNEGLNGVEYALDFFELYYRINPHENGFRMTEYENRKGYSDVEKKQYFKHLKVMYERMPFDEGRCEAFKTNLAAVLVRLRILVINLFRINIKGEELLKRNAIYVCNHKRMLDVPMCYCVLNKIFSRVLTKRSFESSLLGGYMRDLGIIFVDRDSKKSGKAAQNLMIQALVNGESVCLFPEGTRNRTKQTLLGFKMGAVYMAQVTGCPIVPLVIKKQKGGYEIVVLDSINVSYEDSLKAKNKELRRKMISELERCNMKREQKKVLPTVKIVLEMSSCLIAVFTFVLSVFPNINFLSSNYEEKAKAGHAASQIYLAHYYYEVGNLEQSLYWYKLASGRGKYQGVASNNLAVLYEATEVMRAENTMVDSDDQKLECLVKSAVCGNEVGIENLCNFLEKRNLDYYDNFTDDEIARIEQIVMTHKGEESLEDYMPQYVYKGSLQTVDQVIFSTDNTAYKLLSMERVLSRDGMGYVTYRMYDVYEQDVDTQIEPLKYDDSVRNIGM